MKNNKYIKGFTLAELAIVIAVIAILIIFVVPNLGKIAENSEGSSALSKAKDLYAQYVIDNSKEGFIDDELYVEVEDGYVHYLNGDPVKNGETYLVNQIFINDDVLSSSGKYVESPFKTHESIKEEFLKDFKLYARSYRYDFDKSDPLNIYNALNDEASKLVDLIVGENTEKISIAEAFILRETNPKKFVKWSWLYDLIKTEAEEELSNEAIIKNICSFLLDGNTDLEPNVFEGVDFSNYYGEYYEDIPRDDFLNNVDTEIPSFTINFDLAGGEWIDIDSVVNEYQEGEVIVLNNPTKNGYTFLGWYDENDNQVTELTMPDKEVSLEAKWEIVTYTISYDLDGVELNSYSDTIDNIINDLLKDYNNNRGTSFTADSFYALKHGLDANHDSQYLGGASLFLYSSTYKAKWRWLGNYIAEVASAANKKAWNEFYDYSSQSELNGNVNSGMYMIAYELRGFVGQKQYTQNSNFKTANYSDPNIQNKIWSYLKISDNKDKYLCNYNFENIQYTIESENINLPTVNKDGFKGWYNGDQKMEIIPTGTTGNIVLTAKWKSFVGTPTKMINVSKYDNSGNAASNNSGSGGNGLNYICDFSILPKNEGANSLRWQNKILLVYQEDKKAYLVIGTGHICSSNTEYNIADNKTWDYAICSISNSINTWVTEGQYIVINEELSTSMPAFIAYVYNADQYK